MAKAVINGIGIYYEIAGNGPPIVIIAGQGSGPAARQPLIDGLARHHTVLTFDPRGTGRSDPAAQGDSMETLAGDALELMNQAGFDQVGLIGLSTGTGQATFLASAFPERIDRLLLAAPWTHGDAYFHTLQNLRKAAAAALPPDQYVRLNSVLLYCPAYLKAQAARFDELARRAGDTGQDAQGIAARLDAILDFDARPHYGRIACPTLVCGARDDLVMPLWFAQAAADAIAHARFVAFEEGGHMFFESRTDEFLRAALPFLSKHV